MLSDEAEEQRATGASVLILNHNVFHYITGFTLYEVQVVGFDHVRDVVD